MANEFEKTLKLWCIKSKPLDNKKEFIIGKMV